MSAKKIPNTSSPLPGTEPLSIERWIKASVAAGKFQVFIMLTVQSLGRLDLVLSEQSKRLLQRFSAERETVEFSLEMNDHMTLAYLWILGAYEILRSIAQRLSKQPQRFREAKASLERIRIPLAKDEPAKKHAATDSAVAYPIFHFQHGVGRQVNQSTVFTRSELARVFLEGLESLIGP